MVSAAMQVERLSSKDPCPPEKGETPAHWVGDSAESFQNPWPSGGVVHGLMDIFQLRFGRERNFVPIPENKDKLVAVRQPDWGQSQDEWEDRLKVTWLGHAGFLVETAVLGKGNESQRSGEDGYGNASSDSNEARRGVRILFDAVFSERTSPFTFLGPKRFTPTPCALSDLPDVDLIVTSHDHYDHMDLVTIKQICEQQRARSSGIRPRFVAGLGNARHFLGAGADIKPFEITECDWWDSLKVTIPGTGSVELTCTPAQHNSGRTPFDKARTLWCSWGIKDLQSGKQMYFAGDTGYRAQSAPSACPVFKQIGEVFGGFDLALLPIGCFMPREFMGNVHCSPEDSLQVHKDIRSRRSIGMHWGAVRGGLSMHYEDVREPPRRWQRVCEEEGRWGSECGLCDVGETIAV